MSIVGDSWFGNVIDRMECILSIVCTGVDDCIVMMIIYKDNLRENIFLENQKGYIHLCLKIKYKTKLRFFFIISVFYLFSILENSKSVSYYNIIESGWSQDDDNWCRSKHLEPNFLCITKLLLSLSYCPLQASFGDFSIDLFTYKTHLIVSDTFLRNILISFKFLIKWTVWRRAECTVLYFVNCS